MYFYYAEIGGTTKGQGTITGTCLPEGQVFTERVFSLSAPSQDIQLNCPGSCLPSEDTPGTFRQENAQNLFLSTIVSKHSWCPTSHLSLINKKAIIVINIP